MNNSIVRTLSGTVLIVLVASCLLINQYLFAAFALFMLCTMLAEFFKMTMGDKYRFSRLLGIIAGAVTFILAFLKGAFDIELKYLCLALVPVFVIMLNSLLEKDKSQFFKFAYIYTGLAYIVVPLTLSNLIVFRNGSFSGLLLLCFFIIIWGSDVGGYVFGMALGQKYGKKLCPEISPKKSWIGFWGGLVFAILATILLHVTGLLRIPFGHGVILAMIMHVGGVVGDLFESQWKRCCGIKDSGNVIPGHGGMLDRFDSTLVAMPLGALYLSLVNLI
ncbi:MAG: phosphatidate cytidylyltransferase [Bacteroidales bacterium]|nr:phosphatidate cytidylyltransferase [Candidatus Cryptobacteroides onthequi]MCQ2165498.1 phosphatidate cytidylyltransferase [Bacteroidales bacterium]